MLNQGQLIEAERAMREGYDQLIGDYAAFFLWRVLPYLSAIFLRNALR